MKKQINMLLLAATMLGGTALAVDVKLDDQKLEAERDGKAVLTYWRKVPDGTALTVSNAAFFHPFATPSGVTVTDLAPSDHKHHRGIFLAWFGVQGATSGDFWGWGAHAPLKGRKILNQNLAHRETDGVVSFDAENIWDAEGTTMINERLAASVADRDGVRVLDLVYNLTPQLDLTLSKAAFSGFSVRLRKDGAFKVFSPAGLATNKAPSHLKPETDWPDAKWYAGEITLADGSQFGAAVVNHPNNPATLWHNAGGIRLLNPCIVAPTELKLPAGAPLVLRYRVIAFDGQVPSETLNKLADEWAASGAK